MMLIITALLQLFHCNYYIVRNNDSNNNNKNNNKCTIKICIYVFTWCQSAQILTSVCLHCYDCLNIIQNHKLQLTWHLGLTKNMILVIYTRTEKILKSLYICTFMLKKCWVSKNNKIYFLTKDYNILHIDVRLTRL